MFCFCFKQKTAYEMRIRDWSSDVCSSDLGETYLVGGDHLMRSASREVVEHPEDYVRKAVATGTKPDVADRVVETGSTLLLQQIDTDAVSHALNSRSEERRVGKECVRPSRVRWWSYY